MSCLPCSCGKAETDNGKYRGINYSFQGKAERNVWPALTKQTNRMNAFLSPVSSYESLLIEEQSGTQEMSVFDRKLESWLVIPKATHIKPEGPTTSSSVPEKSESSSSSSMPPAVIAFEVCQRLGERDQPCCLFVCFQRFLQQTGGRHGGWDSYDHQIFLRVLATHPTVSPQSYLCVKAKIFATSITTSCDTMAYCRSGGL